MADVRPLRALRPRPDLAAAVAAPPYDVVDVPEARAIAAGNPHSFLHVSRPEIDLGDAVDPHADAVHAQGRATLEAFVADGVLLQDDTPSYYVYRQRYRLPGDPPGAPDRTQTGLVACTAVADYTSGVIRTHEFTRPDKEDDRVRHIAALDAHDEPVLLLTAPGDPDAKAVHDLLAPVTATPPLYDLTADDGIRHQLWRIDGGPDDAGLVAAVRSAFADVAVLYVADGHHRSAAAARVAVDRPDDPEAQAFLAVIFPGEELAILPYNRVLAQAPARLLERLHDVAVVEASPQGAVEPGERGTVGMYARVNGVEGPGRWFRVRFREAAPPDPVGALDVSLLQDRVLGPLFGIGDPRTDTRIGFVGGSRGTAELERLVDSGRYEVAFALHPTSVAELVAVAATGRVMPPKSTWFEPKLRSGLFLHSLP